MTVTATELDLLLADAAADENTGDVQRRAAVITARATLATRRMQGLPEVRAALAAVRLDPGGGLGPREVAALAAEAADPVSAITVRALDALRDPDDDDDPKHEEWGGNSVLTKS